MANLLQKSFVLNKNGEYLIPNPDIKSFRTSSLKPSTKLCYSSLIKLYAYLYLLKYEGKDEYIKYLIKSIEDGDIEVIEIFNKLPINNGVLSNINKAFNLKFKTTSDDDLESLEKLDDVVEKIFTDKNIREFTNIVSKLSKVAQDSEDVTRIMLRHLWSKNYDVIEAHEKGIDLWRLNKDTGERDSIKIKSISESVHYKMKDQMIIIEPTLIEMTNFNSNFEKLPYDYLVFFDRSHKIMNRRNKKYESAPQIHILKTNAINKITVEYNTKRSIQILLNNWALTPNYYSSVYRTYNVPFKFTGKKFA